MKSMKWATWLLGGILLSSITFGQGNMAWKKAVDVGFAPTNSAFDKLPEGTVASLLKPENKLKLSRILTYHVISGKSNVSDIAVLVRAGHGKAELSTVSGDKLWVMMEGNNMVLKDGKGNVAAVTISDVNQSNGVIHVIDSVMLPE